MPDKHKSLNEQVMVITGASSGIGMTTAEKAAKRGARVVLAARSGNKLETIVERLDRNGTEASYVTADVSQPADVTAVVNHALREYGRIDTWVNNAAQSIYGSTEKVDIEDARRIFDVNYFGYVNGCKTVIPIMRRAGSGVIINVGSVVSDVGLPLQSHYVATKHAIKGFTDALRTELEGNDDPIELTLIKPGSINTPFSRHAKNYMSVEPSYPPPVYKPEVVARTILSCAVKPRREVLVGAGAKKMQAVADRAPKLADKYFGKKLSDAQQSDRPTDGARRGNLYQPMADEGPTRYGDYEGHVRRTSVYTQARLHPWLATAGAALMGAGAAFALKKSLGAGLRKASSLGALAWGARRLLKSRTSL